MVNTFIDQLYPIRLFMEKCFMRLKCTLLITIILTQCLELEM